MNIKKITFSLLIITMLVLGAVLIPTVSAKSDSAMNTIDMDMTEEGGVFIVPTSEDSIINLRTTQVSEKTASAILSGTIDKDNQITLEGTIILDGKEKKVKLSGKAKQVFVGWDVPKSAEPIYTKVGNTTMTRYIGSTERYATYVDVIDKSGQYNLHGEFYDDGTGYFIGSVFTDGKECKLGLIGNSMSTYENTIPTIKSRSSSSYISVPTRSQWELYPDHGMSVAELACGETTAAMLEEYYTQNAPNLWDIWVYNSNDSMSDGEAQDYLDDQGVYLQKGTRSGTLSYTLDNIKNMVEADRPFYLTENSRWGTCHAVVLRGYYESGTASRFILNDPNTWTGTNTMYWYESTSPYFNYEENVYEYTGSSDTTSTGYSFLG